MSSAFATSYRGNAIPSDNIDFVVLQENEIVRISMDIRRFQKGQLTEDDSPELHEVMQANAKLKHRLSILNAVSRMNDCFPMRSR